MSIEKVCCPSCHHYGNNQHERDQVSYRCGKCGTTWPRVDMLDDTQYCPMCEEAGKQLEAAKQRELELLAVIERMRKSIGMVISAVDGGVTHMIKDSLGEVQLKEAFALSAEPSQALREHEAKVAAEYKKRAEAAESKLRELEMQEPVQLEVSICGIKWPFKCAQPLYAKPFPSKQGDK